MLDHGQYYAESCFVQVLLVLHCFALFDVFLILFISNIAVNHRRTQDFAMEGVHVLGAGTGGLADGSPPVGSKGKALVGDLGDKVPQKLKQNVKLAYNF